MNKIENILLELFENYPQLTTAQIVEHTALARRTIQKYLSQLVSKKQIEAYGEGRGRYYQRVYSHKETKERVLWEGGFFVLAVLEEI